MSRPPPAERILVIRLGAMGDVVRTLPAVSRLRCIYPGAHIAWLVEAAARGVVDGSRDVDEVLVFPRGELVDSLKRLALGDTRALLVRLMRTLRGRRFDLVLDFHSILRSGVLSRLTGAPRRLAFAPPLGRELAHLFATHKARVAPARCSRFERNDALVDALGAPASGAASPFSVAGRPRSRDPAGGSGVGPGWAVLHPGTSPGTSYKRLPVDVYGRIAEGLAERPGLACVVTWGPGERGLAEAVVAASHGVARLADATASPGELAAVVARASVFIGSDSGPLHLASLVGTPVVQLLGPTDPVENAPWPETLSRTVHHPLACSPCRRGCASAACMSSITPEEVCAATRDLLAAAAARAGASISRAG